MTSEPVLSIQVNLREGRFFIPTTYLAHNGRRSLAPVEIVAADDRAGFVSAVQRAHSPGNPELEETVTQDQPGRSPLLIAAGVRSWRAFYRGLRAWSVVDDRGTICISRWMLRRGGGMLPDGAPDIALPIGSTITDAANLLFDLVQADVASGPPAAEPASPARRRRHRKSPTSDTGFTPSRKVERIASAYAEDARDLARDGFGIELDWSDESVREVERILAYMAASLRDANPPEDRIDQAGKMFGSYVGEVCRRNHGAAWGVMLQGSQKLPALQPGGSQSVTWPWARARSRLTDGDENNVWDYFVLLIRPA